MRYVIDGDRRIEVIAPPIGSVWQGKGKSRILLIVDDEEDEHSVRTVDLLDGCEYAAWTSSFSVGDYTRLW